MLRSFMSDETRNVVDRTAAAHFLHAVYSRSRWSDFRHVKEIVPDFDDKYVGYLEVTAQWHKTAKNTDVKSKLLPVVAPCQGVAQEPWVKQWTELRRTVNLPVAGEVNGPLFPVPDVKNTGEWTKPPVEAKEATTWLRSILDVMKEGSRTTASSHSLKSTPLSWCSKYGIPEADQNVLGRHVAMGSKHVYARELIAKPLRSFEEVIKAIREKTFDPDRARSGYFKYQEDEVRCLEQADLDKEPQEVRDEKQTSEVKDQDQAMDESPSSGETEASNLEESGSESEHARKVRKVDGSKKDGNRYAYLKVGIVRVLARTTFVCGKQNSDNYVKVDSRKDAFRVTCQRCFRTTHTTLD